MGCFLVKMRWFLAVCAYRPHAQAVKPRVYKVLSPGVNSLDSLICEEMSYLCKAT